MKKLNKNIMAIAILLGLTSISYVSADMEMSDWKTYIKMTNEGSMNYKTNQEYLNLRWKIDWYKVVLNWSPYAWEYELLGYRVEFKWPNWAENTLSVDSTKTSLENWDALTWENKYQVFAVWNDWDLKKSNEIVLKMWANWGYDFSNKTQSWTYKKEIREEYKEKIEWNREEMKDNREEFRQENWNMVDYLSGYTQEEKDELFELRKEYQEELNELLSELKSTDLTEEDIAEIKADIEELKAEYLDAVKEIVWEDEQVLKFLELRMWVFRENQQLRDENKDLREDMRQEMWTWMMNSFQWGNKIMDKKMELRQKYKKVFAKPLESKIENIPVEKLKLISSRIDTLIEKYSSMDMDETKKEKTIAQLEAIKEIIDDKLTTSEDMLDIDEILNVDETE